MFFRDNTEIKNSDKYKVEIGERHAILTIKHSDRTDDGPYRLQCENDLGSDSAIIKLAINGSFGTFSRLRRFRIIAKLWLTTASWFQLNWSKWSLQANPFW